MQKSGYHSELQSLNTPAQEKKKTRRRNIVWFNPPFSEHVGTNIGKIFLRLLAKHFPPHHRLHKICNKNNVKLSYSCMPNMAAVISRHNKKNLTTNKSCSCRAPPCNCRDKKNCPLKGDCRESSIIYKATISAEGVSKNYYGCSETQFKTRYNNHKQSFNYRHKRNATELSKTFWKWKDAGQDPCIEWNIAAHTKPYQPGARWCNLCLAEKLIILKADPSTSLNKRSELNGKCRHKNKFKLKKFSIPN